MLDTDTGHVRLVPIDRVRLLDGPFLDAQRLAGESLLALDVDRLLAPYLREAGLPSGPSYGNWESDGLDGHMAGHALSAAALQFAATGDERFHALASALVDGFERAQLAGGTGYLGGIPRSAEFWATVADGVTDDTFRQRWVPWYNLHKMLAGLVDAHRYADIAAALPIALRFADWWIGVAAGIDDDAFQIMLDTEFGGIGETLVDLALLAGRDDLLDAAARFVQRSFIEPLTEGRDELEGLHANTQIPKILALQALASARPDAGQTTAVETFWDTVVRRRSVSIGGNSVREHFHAIDDFTPMIDDREGPESCNSHNMARLGLALFERTGDPAVLDHVERIAWNHTLASQHPDHGGFVYFTPMRPGHYRVYSAIQTSMWCCVGTALEAGGRHGAGVFATRDSAVLVNLLIAAEAELRVSDATVRVRVRVETDRPDAATIRVLSAGSSSTPVRIGVRQPVWATGATISLDGVAVDAELVDGYLMIDRTWAPDDVVDVRFDAVITAEPLPDGSPWVSYRHGPVVLAARHSELPMPDLIADDGRVAQIARGPLAPLADAPMVRGAADDVLVSGETHRLRTVDGGAVELVPFSRIHDARYAVYFPVAGADPAAHLRRLQASDARSLGLDGRTIDHVVFGEQQPEADHAFVGDGSVHGRLDGRTFRRTAGELAVVLQDFVRLGRSLQIDLLGDASTEDYAVMVEGVAVAVTSVVDADGLRTMEYAIAETSTGRHEVRLIARHADAGRVHRVRVLR